MTQGDITQLLEAVYAGQSDAEAQLVERVYRELRTMARGFLANESASHTLQPTALVNEAYMRLLPLDQDWRNRRYFFGAAARAMRRILTDHARQKRANKRGGDIEKVTFESLAIEVPEPAVDVLDLANALDDLAHNDGRLADVVQLRYFVGLTFDQTAELLEVSITTVKRDWVFARTWLLERLS